MSSRKKHTKVDTSLLNSLKHVVSAPFSVHGDEHDLYNTIVNDAQSIIESINKSNVFSNNLFQQVQVCHNCAPSYLNSPFLTFSSLLQKAEGWPCITNKPPNVRIRSAHHMNVIGGGRSVYGPRPDLNVTILEPSNKIPIDYDIMIGTIPMTNETRNVERVHIYIYRYEYNKTNKIKPIRTRLEYVSISNILHTNGIEV